MSISPLSELRPGNHDWMVHVFVSRLSQRRGATDDGPIKHTDIVFQDTAGNHMYGEITATLVDQFIDRLQEGKVYVLRRFFVSGKKNQYRPVEADFIIRFGRYTTVQEIHGTLMDYPLCTYALTAIDELPSPLDTPESFTDVVGIFTGVSATSQYHSASRSTPSTKRVVYLSDLSGYEISIVLWGERATAFEGEVVLETARTKPVVILFVGTLVKPFEGRRSLSGGAPCRWYINEDLTEINELRAQLKDNVPAVRGISLPGQTPAEIRAQVDLETKTLKELKDLNAYDHRKTKFYCTVDITKLSPGERWWFHACTACNKGTIPYGAAYRCPDKDCGATGGVPRYRVCYLASDGTEELEFVFFEKAGRELIGKPVLTLIRSRAPRAMSLEEAIVYARTDQSTPRELAAVISKKYRFVVSVSSKSFLPETKHNSYQVHRVELQHGKKARTFALGRGPGLAFASTSSSACSSGLSPAGDAMANDLVGVRTDSLTAGTNLSGAPSADDVADSTVGFGLVLPQTPPSVSKPPAAIDGKAIAGSSVQQALFTESPEKDVPPGEELGAQVEFVEDDLLEVDKTTVLARVDAPASTEKTTDGRKRSRTVTNQPASVDPAKKKNKS